MSTQNPSTSSRTLRPADRDRVATTLRAAQVLVGCFLGLSAVTLLAVVLLRHHTGVVTTAVWIRTVVVLADAVLTFVFLARARRGSRGGYRRLRIVSIVMLVAVVVIVALPGTFPVWLRAEQAVCGLLLLGVVLLVNRRHVRSSFAAAA